MVLGRIRVAAARTELHDSLDTSVQGLLLLPDDVLRHSFAYWAVRSLGQDDRNHARKALVSPTPIIKIGFLLGRSPVGRQGLATRA